MQILWISSIFSVSGVMFDDFAPQAAPVDVGINLGCADAFVAKHALDGTEIGTAFQQVGGEGVAEGMRTDVLGQSDGFTQDLDDVEYHDAGNVLASLADEYIVLVAGLDFL